jgi:mannose-6-phosphate isomerase-like protein (cupin superfamily)
MATITILPGEQFEHIHSESSTSKVVSGTGRMVLQSNLLTVKQGDNISVPANCSHSFTNTGITPLVIECGYGPR